MSPGLLLTRQVSGCFGTVFPEKEGPVLGLVRRDQQGDFLGTEESNITCKAHGKEGKSQRSL